MNSQNTYTAEEVSALTGFDAQSLRNQAKADIAQGPEGPNGANFNAFLVGNTLKFPKNWIDQKLGIGPAFDLPAWLADLAIKLRLAVEEVPDEES